MSSKRNRMASIKTKKLSFGTSRYAKTSPARAELAPTTSTMNPYLTFEEALKLNLSIDECIRKLNTYNRSTVAGKSRGLNLAIHLDQERITVNETTV
jgi:hypothetical protein